jgi:hypothetical protein
LCVVPLVLLEKSEKRKTKLASPKREASRLGRKDVQFARGIIAVTIAIRNKVVYNINGKHIVHNFSSRK